jgi:hypothetical protein
MSLAACNHEAATGYFPPGRKRPDFEVLNGTRWEEKSMDSSYPPWPTRPGRRNNNFSVHIWILPYMEQGNVYDMIDFNLGQSKQMLSTDGSTPINPHYNAYATASGLFICPSDPFTQLIISENNYRCNFGGSTPFAGHSVGDTTADGDKFSPDKPSREGDSFPAGGNGAFSYSATGFRSKDYQDGLSRTIFFSERTKGSGNAVYGGSDVQVTKYDMIGLGQGNSVSNITANQLLSSCLKPAITGPIFYGAGRWLPGDIWSNGWPFAGYDATEYNHVAPPNWEGIDCGSNSSIPDAAYEHALVAARSEHPGTVVVGYGDGHTSLINDSIDLALWRALGTRNLQETIQADN